MGTTLSADERKYRAQIGAHTSWASSPDGLARTAKARATFRAMWAGTAEDDAAAADPHGIDPGEAQKRRDKHLRAAELARAQYDAAKARRLAEEAQSDDTSATP